jgi:autotransporter-associated beta strand protein
MAITGVAPAAAQTYGNGVVVLGDAAVMLISVPSVTLGPLTIGSNALSAGGDPGSSLTFGSTTLIGNPTFNPADGITLTLGALNGSGSPRTITKSGPGTLVLASPASALPAGVTTISAGTLRVTNTDGSATGNGMVAVQTAGTLAGTGSLSGSVTNSGTVAPGNAGPGTLRVGPDSPAAAGHLRTEIGGPPSGSENFDRLVVNGSATLGGTLDLQLLNAFTPATGDAFSILAAGSRVGMFANVTGVTQLSTAGLSLAVTYSPTAVFVTAALPGDVNLDLVVGPGDFNLLASHFGQNGQTWSTGDLDGDGTVGPGDFNLLATNFGRSAAGGFVSIEPADRDALQAFAVSVPDPTSLPLAGLVAAAWAAKRRRGARRSRS